MNKLGNVVVAMSLIIVAVLVVLNWSSLMIPAPLNLIVAQVQAPLGVVMLGLAVVMVTLFLVAYLRNQIATLLETRKLHKEIERVQEEMQRVQGLADNAEASRVENLHQLIATEFRLLNERLGPVSAEQLPAYADREGTLRSLTELVTGREPTSRPASKPLGLTVE